MSLTARILRRRLPPPPRLLARALPSRLHSTAAAAAVAAPSPSDVYPSPSPPAPPFTRLETLRATSKPFSAFLTDSYSRQHNYLRISITERCNLRCLYCMPAEGVPLSPAAHLLSTPEILELASLFVAAGVTKIRLTGGEPTVRKDVLPLIEALGELRGQGLHEIAMTSNGVALGERKLRKMVDAGLTALNLSLDTLVPAKFEFMTRRKGLERVLATLEEAGRLGFGCEGGPGKKTVKVNVVVMKGVNEEEIVDFVEMTKDREVEVRFIEYMPFDGNKWAERKMFPFASMLETIKEKYPAFTIFPNQRPNDTAKTFHVPGFAGRVGFITSMTENFCGTCNRLRITGDGNIKVCLFGNEEVSLRDIMREYRSPDAPVGAGGEAMRERLREVIGGAVGRKEEGHRPSEELVANKNRPMILIDKSAGVHNSVFPALGFTAGRIPTYLLPRTAVPPYTQIRHYARNKDQLIKRHWTFTQPPSRSAKITPAPEPTSESSTTSPSPTTTAAPPLENAPSLPHLTPTGTAHMVSIHAKAVTTRTATAVGTVHFTSPHPLHLIATNSNKKGDVLALARISGIIAAKKTPELVVLCHPIAISSVEVDVETIDSGENGAIAIRTTVKCEGKTGVEMEAMAAVMGAALAVVDMCKAVDKGIWIGGVRVVEKRGGRSGDWVEGVKVGEWEGADRKPEIQQPGTQQTEKAEPETRRIRLRKKWGGRQVRSGDAAAPSSDGDAAVGTPDTQTVDGGEPIEKDSPLPSSPAIKRTFVQSHGDRFLSDPPSSAPSPVLSSVHTSTLPMMLGGIPRVPVTLTPGEKRRRRRREFERARKMGAGFGVRGGREGVMNRILASVRSEKRRN